LNRATLLVDPIAALFRTELSGSPPLVLDETSIEVQLVAPLARVLTARRFTNSSDQWVEAVLTLPPIAPDEILYGLEVWLDGVVYHALPQAPQAARRAQDVAVAAGRRAILYEVLEHGVPMISIAGIKPGCIRDGYLNIEYKIVKGKGADELKTDYRIRRIKITKAIHEILVKAIIDIKGENLFTLPDGRPFSAEKFQRLVWKRALEQAGIAYRKPYTTRHTFAAWSLTLGTDPNRLVSLMGHASKQMVYEVYGKYTEGLEEDREDILGYFGHDFLTRGKQKEEGAKVFCESSVPVDESYWYCGA